MKPGISRRSACLLLLATAGLATPLVRAQPVKQSPQVGPATDSPPGSSAPAYEDPSTMALVAFVEKAARGIEARGEAIFPEFRKKDGPWFSGERYVFVMDLEGNRYVYPPDPANERLNLLADTDLGGKPIGRMLVDRAKLPQGRGWVHYQWNRPNPNDRRPVWKSTYVVRATAPSGKTYLVASGIYEGPMEKAFVVDEVEAAAALLQREGRSAFAPLRDKQGRFFFRDTYVFVNSPDGVELVNPAFPDLEGRNLLALKDSEGKLMVKEYIELALKEGSGWITYLWPQPDRSKLPVRKTTYVRKVVLPGGEVLIVGSGVYEP
jgi:signal transduction histidine kinase